MSGLSVQANHYVEGYLDRYDDWTSLTIGDQVKSLRSERDIRNLLEELRDGRIPGASLGDYTQDGHKVTIGGEAYDLENADDTARFAADLRDGTLDGATAAGSAAAIFNGSDIAGKSVTVDGRTFALHSENDLRELVNAVGGKDAHHVGGKVISAGGQKYDVANEQQLATLIKDLEDGALDGVFVGAQLVEPTATATATAAATAAATTGPALDANGYPTIGPDQAGYEVAWTDWVKAHTYEEFKKALDKGIIPDSRKLFADGEFGMAVRNKGDESSRFWEMLSFMQRNKQQIFEHLSRGWA